VCSAGWSVYCMQTLVFHVSGCRRPSICRLVPSASVLSLRCRTATCMHTGILTVPSSMSCSKVVKQRRGLENGEETMFVLLLGPCGPPRRASCSNTSRSDLCSLDTARSSFSSSLVTRQIPKLVS
jgi:hypothetical protein